MKFSPEIWNDIHILRSFAHFFNLERANIWPQIMSEKVPDTTGSCNGIHTSFLI